MIGWIQISRNAVAIAEQALQTDSQGVRDEVGFLELHQAFSDRFFPGTSVLHTRLRYILFIPWLMELSCGDPNLFREYELKLTEQLKDSPKDNQGVIGATVWPELPSQTASMIYWSALSRWKILSGDISVSRQAILKRIKVTHKQSNDQLNQIDGEFLFHHESSPFVLLPAAPPELLKSGKVLNFRLTKQERNFIRKKLIGVRVASDNQEQSLLARLADLRLPVAALDVPWADEILSVSSESDKHALLLAKNVSALAGIGRAVYTALVEKQKADYSSRHFEHLKYMVDEHGKQGCALDINKLKNLFPNLSPEPLNVLIKTQYWLKSKSKNLTKELQQTFTDAEQIRKGSRARLSQSLAGQKRRAEWIGDEHPLAEPLHYRWRNVRILLTDLNT